MGSGSLQLTGFWKPSSVEKLRTKLGATVNTSKRKESHPGVFPFGTLKKILNNKRMGYTGRVWSTTWWPRLLASYHSQPAQRPWT